MYYCILYAANDEQSTMCSTTERTTKGMTSPPRLSMPYLGLVVLCLFAIYVNMTKRTMEDGSFAGMMLKTENIDTTLKSPQMVG